MRFRIAQFVKADEKGNKFFIEKGIEYSVYGWLGIKHKNVAWDQVNGTDGQPLAYKSLDEAVIVVEELKKQIPIYHEIA